jgi:hypothetical protein
MTHATPAEVSSRRWTYTRESPLQILRHSKIVTTMEIYTHVPSEVTRRALKQLGASLDGLSG